jgi:hypothetical protein
MKMNSLAFVTFMAVAMIASAGEAGKHGRIATNEIVKYRAGAIYVALIGGTARAAEDPRDRAGAHSLIPRQSPKARKYKITQRDWRFSRPSRTASARSAGSGRGAMRGPRPC